SAGANPAVGIKPFATLAVRQGGPPPGPSSRSTGLTGGVLCGSRPGKPFGVLIALTAKISDPFSAQECKVALSAGRHRAPAEIAIFLSVALAVHNIRAQSSDVEIGGNWRQPFIVNRGHDRLTVGAVERLAPRHVIHLIIFDSRSDQLGDHFRK